jgi:putative serine protease PepD
MNSYEDPNHTPFDAADERATGHDVPVGRAVPPVPGMPGAPDTPGTSGTPGAPGAPGAPVAPPAGPMAGGEQTQASPRPAGFLPPGAFASIPSTGTPANEPRRRRRGRRIAVASIAALVIAAGGGVAGAAGVHALDHSSATAALNATPVQTVAGTSSIADVVAAVDQEVVSITVQGQQSADEGSGVVVRSDGLILTNNHVIAAAANGGTVQVTLNNGKTVNATVVKADANEDLALIQAQGVSGLRAATFGNSDNLQIGDTVIAIGNELGLPNSVSAGIVSALHRKVTVAGESPNGGFGAFAQQSSGTTYNDAIQTDASVNQGDSGGALFNLSGQVIGINSAIATAAGGSTGSVGIGFAISSNTAKAFVASANA